MPRLRAARAAWYAGQELDTYLRQRAWHWTVKRNYALAADYCIRLLNRHPQDTLGLVLGEVSGRYTSQDTFVSKCAQALQESCQRKGVASVTELVQCTLVTRAANPPSLSTTASASLTQLPSADAVLALQADEAKREADARDTGAHTGGLKGESLYVHNSEPPDSINQAVRRSCLRSATPPLAELLEPVQSTYGRGLYATRHIQPRSSILCESPLLVQRCDDTKCAHCLAPLSARRGSSITDTGASDPLASGVACPHCQHETYCSEDCRDAAWEQYHVCSCASRNPELAQWTEGMRELLHRGGAGAASAASDEAGVVNSGSEARAALSCLTVAKICAMATVQQVHPLSLPGISCLRGIADYEPATALSEIGALAVALSAALRQPNLYMEEVLSLFALLHMNEFFAGSGIAVYSVLSMLNHSCDPNCALVSAANSPVAGAHGSRRHKSAMEKHLVALRPIRDGEQLFIDYNAALTTRLDYEERKALCAQRHFECYCSRCIRRE
ncbi:MYND finger/SET domain containing protein [Leishmania donovani]|uniref:MYND_finger/SET_domain_containing_protein_-_putative n=3 Tax=Leishmania donovani species complex TaxID=38574 RepID=A0A6L0WJ20_LEIIN|nr:conserved hypothetical protein [Leishmania infantum JPCM5]TPP49735.1 SET domain family protein [Leishmania donovani]CAC9446768.1 MYND_finger/SET_domain_containing_protein_-_putative [Leishmania infantum]CAJ1986201.1 MYND finger/SET domain containing protein [Leishmania donovani]CAM65535.1 conserved hypothetical protein [Leishmania infantum JPCM5]SUZ39149.1 MYND_finger/SET_domain_containing_protein_-_putative [Leishmania infantum]|eukprot:XP_001463183.1 conserved hypothetical protein [Leishmania infantum JPCM5]